MFRLIRRAIGGIFIVIVAVVVFGGGLLTQVPDPTTGLKPDGTYAESSWNQGDTIAVDTDSEVAELVCSFDASLYPDYYRVIGVSTTAREGKPAGITYGELDELGRSVGVSGWITGAMRAEARERGRSDADLPDPTGWPDENNEVEIMGAPGRRDYHGWFWNRSHLIADSLGGEPTRENLIAGTRTENVGDNATPGGMAYAETLARDWLDAHPEGSLWYAASPVYIGDELIPRAVIVDIKTDDDTIDEKIVVYNTAYGWSIDYATGEATPA